MEADTPTDGSLGDLEASLEIPFLKIVELIGICSLSLKILSDKRNGTYLMIIHIGSGNGLVPSANNLLP